MLPRLAVFLLVVAAPSAALANVIWPAAILTARELAWWVIGASLLIEAYFVWLAFRLPFWSTLWAAIAANAVSAAIGLFAVPFLGIAVAAVLHYSGLGEAIHWEDFGPADWAVTFAMAVAFNVAIELAVFRYGYRLTVDKRAAGLIALANVVTVGFALVSLDVVPDADYGEVSPGIVGK
jgi:hypothetical protein